MNIVLLSGGSGKRLWPLSNDIRSKQFIKMFRNAKGDYESMIMRTYRQINEVLKDADITIATNKTQVSAIKSQLGEDVSISIEPDRRDTFPAIVLAGAFLADVKKISKDEVVLISPVDPYVGNDYFESLKKLYDISKESTYNLSLMGVEPTYPSEKYGYIIPNTRDSISQVQCFKEKPDEQAAKTYINSGALWNCGVFAFKLGYLLDIAHAYLDFSDYYDLYKKYATLKKTSFDYAVVEKEASIACLRFTGQWKDMGTWNTFVEGMDEASIGKVMIDDFCTNTEVVNELDIPILCMGLKDMVVAASGDGILISDKQQSSNIKPYVDKIKEPVKYAEKSWGSFKIIDVQDDSLTIRICLRKGHQLRYHSHKSRDEVWTIISGTGYTIIDGMKQPVKPGDIIGMEAESKHTIIADSDLKIIEVQLGKDINRDDKEIFVLK